LEGTQASEWGVIALMDAALDGDTKNIGQLIGLGAVDINVKDKNGKTALMIAASAGNTGTVVLLVKWGADIYAKDNEGKTASMLAADHGNVAIVEKLAEFTGQDVLSNDARVFLSGYSRLGAGAGDEEIAIKSLAKIYEGLSKDKGSAEYASAVLCIVKDGNLEFLEGVKLDRYATVVRDYKKITTLFKDLVSFERSRANKTITTTKLIRDNKVEEIKMELGRFKALK
jgi:ankyrin repeat protein